MLAPVCAIGRELNPDTVRTWGNRLAYAAIQSAADRHSGEQTLGLEE